MSTSYLVILGRANCPYTLRVITGLDEKISYIYIAFDEQTMTREDFWNKYASKFVPNQNTSSLTFPTMLLFQQKKTNLKTITNTHMNLNTSHPDTTQGTFTLHHWNTVESYQMMQWINQHASEIRHKNHSNSTLKHITSKTDAQTCVAQGISYQYN
jgi:hypothetical protein